MRRTRFFRVELEVPSSATDEEALKYVADALTWYRKTLRYPCTRGDDDSGDPMWHLNPRKITVAPVKRADIAEQVRTLGADSLLPR